MRLIKPSLVTLLGATFLATVSCGKKEEVAPLPLRPVITFTVEDPSSTVERKFSGLVSSAEGTNIAFEVSGRVVKVIAKEGTRYETGDVLAQIDTSEYENQLNAAKAQLTEAQQALRRTQQLLETGNASTSQLESAISAEKSANSNFKTAQKRVDDSTLKMPYPGVIGLVQIDPQMVVNSGQTVMTIQGEGGMEFEVGIPADIVGDLLVGMSSSISIGSIEDTQFKATIETISPQISDNTTYPVTLRFEDHDPRLREGLDGEAALTIPNKMGSAIAVPINCVADSPDAGKFVWIVKASAKNPEEATVNKRKVEIGSLRGSGHIEVLSGIEPGEVIVSRGVHSLDEGEKVALRTEG